MIVPQERIELVNLVIQLYVETDWNTCLYIVDWNKDMVNTLWQGKKIFSGEIDTRFRQRSWNLLFFREVGT